MLGLARPALLSVAGSSRRGPLTASWGIFSAELAVHTFNSSLLPSCRQSPPTPACSLQGGRPNDTQTCRVFQNHRVQWSPDFWSAEDYFSVDMASFLFLCQGKAGQGWESVVFYVSGFSKMRPWKYPLVLQAVKTLSLFKIIIPGGRSNFGEPVSSVPGHPHKPFFFCGPSFIKAYLPSASGPTANTKYHFNNNNTFALFELPFIQGAQSTSQALINEAL